MTGDATGTVSAGSAADNTGDEVIWSVDDDGIGRITFNRPKQRNAFTLGMYARLGEICADVSENLGPTGKVRVLIMTGAGDKAFGAGTDMTEFRGFEKPEDAWAYEERMTTILGQVEACAVPTIAAIHGACTGGGGAIAAACDLRIASRTLKFGFPIARTLGNCLSADNLSRLSALLGPARVKEILFTARLIEADEALAIGLVSEVLWDQETLMERAESLAQTLLGHAPLTLRATKEALRRNRVATPVEDQDLVAMCYMSADFKHGLEAFLAKRPPEWKGE